MHGSGSAWGWNSSGRLDMDDLSQSKYGVVEMIVEAMHIDENAPAMRQILFHPGLRLRHSGERGDFERGEIGLGIGGQGCRPLHLTGLPSPGGRDGDGDPGQGNPVFALPCEENAIKLFKFPVTSCTHARLSAAYQRLVLRPKYGP